MKRFIVFILLSIGIHYVSDAQEDALRLKQFNIENGIALKGYDPVSYYSGKPLKGNRAYMFTYKSITYLFSSQQNLEKFKSNPAGYEPMYGGWCAYAMGKSGEKVEVDPETFKIVQGKVYLFYNFYFNNTLTDWNKNEAELNKKAMLNWNQYLSN